MKWSSLGMGRRLFAVTACLLASLPTPAQAQVEAELPTVRGVVMRGESPLGGQPVALHRVSAESAGEIAAATAGADGSFAFELPGVPGGTDEVFFVSTRHQGILYFGAAVTDVASLDSIHTLVVYDTLNAPAGGYNFTVSARNVFVEEVEEGWQITDAFDIENRGDRTVIAGADGLTWSYPLMTGAHDVELGDGDLGPDVFAFERGRVNTSAPVPPGTRQYVFRYQVPELIRLPLPGNTTRTELFVREPAASFGVTGLLAEQPVALEPGSTFRRYVGDGLTETSVSFSPVVESDSIPLAWIMVLLALGLGVVGVWATTRTPSGSQSATRAATLLEVARLDEAFDSIESPTAKQERAHHRAREVLMRSLGGKGS